MHLRVATLNIWGLPSWISRDLDARVDAIARSFASLPADVVALQEVWTLAARTRLVEAARDAGLQHAWHNAATFGGSGLVVVSRVPILRSSFHPYQSRGLAHRITHGDYYSGKGFALLELETRPTPVALLNSHLHARYVPSTAGDEYIGHRTAQVLQLADTLSDVALPVIALGDFNLIEGEQEYAVLTGASRLIDVAAHLDRRQPTAQSNHPYRVPDAEDSRIDYVFARDGSAGRAVPLEIRRIYDEAITIDGGTGHYSDHAGLLADFEIQPSQERTNHAPDVEALATAATLLEQGRLAAADRRRQQRLTAGSAGLGAVAAALAARREPVQRRGFVRGALQLGAGFALLGSAAAFALSERFSPEELAGFEAAQRHLDHLSKLSAEGPQP